MLHEQTTYRAPREDIPNDHGVFETLLIPSSPRTFGCDRRTTELKLRRVRRTEIGSDGLGPREVEEVQIEIQIMEWKGARTYTHFGSLTLDPDQAAKMADRLLTLAKGK